MSNINVILGESSFERITSRIASILADEIANQIDLNTTALALEEAKPTPDQALIDFYTLNIESLPSRVWQERIIKVDVIEMPFLNVFFTDNPLDELTTQSTQVGENRIVLEMKQAGISTADDTGDALANAKLQRLAGIVRQIIMDQEYMRLGFNKDASDMIIGYRKCENLLITQPENGGDDANSIVSARLDVIVKATEEVRQIPGVPLQESATTIRVNDPEKGYFWEIK